MKDAYDFIFLGLGIVILVFALIWSRRPPRPPVEIAVGKLGLSLKADTVPFLILLGVIVAGVGVFFRYKGYESRLTALQTDGQGMGRQITELRDELQRFKDYEMSIALAFPGPVNMNTLQVQPYIKKPGSQSAKLVTNAEKEATDLPNVVSMRLGNLNPGDRVFFKAFEGENKRWKSTSEIEVPVARLEMKEDR